jgi:hypothetical protein
MHGNRKKGVVDVSGDSLFYKGEAMLTQSPPKPILVGLFFFLFVTGNTQPGAATPSTSQDHEAPSTKQSKVVVSGTFATTFGDPFSEENGRARINYTLTTSEGKEWVLMFDRSKYWPADGIHGFHLRQVVVKGLIMPHGKLLVESLEHQ